MVNHHVVSGHIDEEEVSEWVKKLRIQGETSGMSQNGSGGNESAPDRAYQVFCAEEAANNNVGSGYATSLVKMGIMMSS